MHKQQPSDLQITKDLIQNFVTEIPSSMPEGWTSNVLVSLVANKIQLNDYGPYYDYSIAKSSQGDSSLDKQSKASFSSDGSFEVYFPTVHNLLDYYLDERTSELSRDPKLCDSKQPYELLLEQTSALNEQAVDSILRQRNYSYQLGAYGCLHRGKTYSRFEFSDYKTLAKAYRTVTNQLPASKNLWFLIRKPNMHIPPSVIIRNIPESISLEQLKAKIFQNTKIEIIDYVKPFRLRETFNSIISAKSIKDCEVMCYFLNNKKLFFKQQLTKCTIHPQSQRTPFDTNFNSYFRSGQLAQKFQALVPHWQVLMKPPKNDDEEEGQITIQPEIPAPSKHLSRRKSN